MSQETPWHAITSPPADNTFVLLAMRYNRAIWHAVFVDGEWYSNDHLVPELNIIGWMPAPIHPYGK